VDGSCCFLLRATAHRLTRPQTILPLADYIVARKMVPIEEAATEFGLRSSEVVDRIQVCECTCCVAVWALCPVSCQAAGSEACS
jgi:hypothetical protein